MKMNKRIFLTMVLAMNVVFAMAQKLPYWVNNKPTPTNDTYLYVVEPGIGQTELEARNLAIAEVFRTTAMRLGIRFDFEEMSRALQEGVEYKTISTTYDIPINKVCECCEKQNNGYKVYVLCQVAKSGESDPDFDEFNACYKGGGNYYAEDALYADGYSVYRNGMQLSDGEIRTMFANTKSYYLYDSGKRIEKSCEDNLAYSLGGWAALYFAGLCQIGWIGGWEVGKGWIITGFVLGGCGLGLVLTPPIRSSIGRNKIRKAVDLYNNGKAYSQNNMEFKYGLTGNGVYLSLSF